MKTYLASVSLKAKKKSMFGHTLNIFACESNLSQKKFRINKSTSVDKMTPRTPFDISLNHFTQ